MTLARADETPGAPGRGGEGDEGFGVDLWVFRHAQLHMQGGGSRSEEPGGARRGTNRLAAGEQTREDGPPLPSPRNDFLACSGA